MPSRLLIVLLLVLVSTSAFAQNKDKGNLRWRETTKVTWDDAGQPVIGGEKALKFVAEAKGWLIVVTGADGAERYLSYAVDEKTRPLVSLSKEKGANCYWRREHLAAGKPRYLGFWEIDAFAADAGPFAGQWLIHEEKSKSLALLDAKERPRMINVVGVKMEYDDLSDGK